MGDYIADAGPLAWPAIILGLVALAAATLYAVRQTERQAAIAKTATAGSLMLALINGLLGYQFAISVRDGAGDINTTLVAAAIGECLNAIVVTLLIAFLVSLLLLIAAFRQRRAANAP